MTRARVLAGGLALLGALHLVWGLWALLAPEHFFDTFPGFGERWTVAYPPYNEHLVSDLGATFTALGVLLWIAAAVRDRRVTVVVLAGVLVFSALHLVFHAAHPGLLSGGSFAASLVSLAFGLLAPAALLVLVLAGKTGSRQRGD